jgi:two-component system NtrC family sensor kinase
MSIRTQVISLLALVFAALIALEVVIQTQVLMPSFAQLEHDDARTSMRRIRYALDSELEALEVVASDWGTWADLYGYMQSRDPQFVATNISPLELRQLEVNTLLICDREGRVLVARSLDLESPRPLGVDLAPDGALPADFPWRESLGAGQRVHGLIRTQRGVMMIAAAPVLDGSGRGTARGFVLMGRLLTPKQIDHLSARAQVKLTMTEDPRPLAGEALSQSATLTSVTAPVPDIYGRPLLRLRVDLPRITTERGQRVVTYASGYLACAAVSVLLILLVILNRVVLAPLERVTRHALAVGRDVESAARLDMHGDNEVARLAREFDRMVERLAKARRELIDQSFRAGFAELAKGVLHNLGNAMTPSVVRLASLEKRLRDIPAADLARAATELAGCGPDEPRAADLREFLRLGCRGLLQMLADAQADLAVIRRQAQVVQGALGELIRSTRTDAVTEQVRLPELVHQTLEIVPDTCRQRLKVETDDSLNRVGPVRVARTVLRMVLQNLIINAAEAIRDGGREHGVLRVAAELVREEDKTQLHLHCTDDGIGIPKQNLERVFEQGFSTKPRESNHGIGLHWCANAIGALGGRIWAVSEGEGLGASMHLLLPLPVRKA